MNIGCDSPPDSRIAGIQIRKVMIATSGRPANRIESGGRKRART
jgi:hypothetical protein